MFIYGERHLRSVLNPTAWFYWLGGTLSEDEYREHLTSAGFTDVVIGVNHVYTIEDAQAAGLLPVLRQAGLETALEVGFSRPASWPASPSATALRPLRSREGVNNCISADF